MATRKPPAEKADKAANKVGDIIDIKPGSLVRRPDGVVVTSGAQHVLDVPGEYTIIPPNGRETTVTAVSEK